MAKKDFGVSVVPLNKTTNTVSVSCCTDSLMNSKELTSITGGNSIDKRKKTNQKPLKKGALEEFQDAEIINENYDLKAFNQNRKRQKSNEKQRKKAKGHSQDSLKQSTKISSSTPE
jgi:LAS superfamily LD-carboxypeptidase LdcB